MEKSIKNEGATRHFGVGKVLYEENKPSLCKELFVIAGVSYNEAALLRLFEHYEVNEFLMQKCCKLSRHFITSASFEVSLPLYVDINRLVTIQLSTLIATLKKQPERIIGKLHKQDIYNIISHLQTANTISQDTYNKYFNVN